MIDDLGAVKLLDLGLATSIVHADPRDEEEERYMVGTPQYMPPEQARGVHGSEFRSDIYALGGTLYHMLTGEPPHSGASVTEVTEKQKYEAPRPIQELNPEISDPTCKLVDRMLAKEPLDRFSSWDVVLRGLDLLINYKRNDGQVAAAANRANTSPLRSALVLFAGAALLAWAWSFANTDKNTPPEEVVAPPPVEVLRPEPAPNLVDIPAFDPGTNQPSQVGLVDPGFGVGEMPLVPESGTGEIEGTTGGGVSNGPGPSGSSSGETKPVVGIGSLIGKETGSTSGDAGTSSGELTPERIHEELESILAEAEDSPEFHRQHLSRLDKLASRADRSGFGELALEVEQEQAKLEAEYQAALFGIILDLRAEAEDLVAQGDYDAAIKSYEEYDGELARQTQSLRARVIRALEQEKRDYEQRKKNAQSAWRDLVENVTSDLIRERSLGAAWATFTTADPIIEEMMPTQHGNLRQKFIDIGNVEGLLLQSFDRQKGAAIRVPLADGTLLEGRVLGSSGTEVQLELKRVGGTGVRRIQVNELAFPEKERRIREAAPDSGEFILGMSALSKNQDDVALRHFENVEAPFGPLLSKKLLDPDFRSSQAEPADSDDKVLKIKKPGPKKTGANKPGVNKPFGGGFTPPKQSLRPFGTGPE